MLVLKKVAKEKLRYFTYLFLGVFLATLVASILVRSNKAYAVDFVFVDRSRITLGEIQFNDGILDGDYTYKEAGANRDCSDFIEYINGNPQDRDGEAYFWDNRWVNGENRCYFDFSNVTTNEDIYPNVWETYDYYCGDGRPAGTTCAQPSSDLIRQKAIENGDALKITLVYSSPSAGIISHYLIEDVIYSIDGEQTYKRDGTNSNIFFKEGEGECADKITLNDNRQLDDSRKDGELLERNGDCLDPKTSDVILGVPTQEIISRLTGERDQQRGTATAENSCESKGGPLAWIMCPVSDIIDGAITWVDEQIQRLLEIDQTAYTNNGLHDAWRQIRNIAYIILVPIMLIMVIGTALGWSFIDAYTVRKAMPRLLVAVLFITISWEITTFLIEFFNAIGRGVMGLLTVPFRNDLGSMTLSEFYGGSIWQGILLLPLAVGLIVAFWLFGGTLLLFVGIGFLVLLLRQLFIIALILAAPLAILAWIFPGNDKLWKSWWSLFSKLLIMFPLIMALIAVGRIFAFIIHENGAGGAGLQGGIIKPFAIMIAWLLPYALIPLTFAFAGGAFATLTGSLQNKSKGLLDRQKQGRAAKLERAAAGNAFKGNNPFSRRASRALQTASLLSAGGLTLDMQKRRDRMTTARGARNFDLANEFLEKNDAARAISGDDDKLWAVMNGTDEASVRRELSARAPERFSDPGVLNQAVTEVMRFKREAGSEVGQVAATIAQSGTGTGFNYRSDGVNDDMFGAIIKASKGDRGLQGRMLAAMRPKALQSGRVGLAGGGYAKSAQIMDKRRESMANGGWISDDSVPGGRRTYGEADARLDLMQDVLQSNAAAAVAGKVEDVRQLAPVMRANVDSALASGNEMSIARELAKVEGKRDAISQIAPQNAEAFDDSFTGTIDLDSLPENSKALFGRALTMPDPDNPREVLKNPDGTPMLRTSGTITYREALDAIRGNADFDSLRPSYARAGVSAAAAAQQAGNPNATPGAIIDPGAPQQF